MNTLLRSIRQLAVHAANTGVNDATAVQADQTQIRSAIDSIDRIATQTQFGTKRLLDGTSGTNAAITDITKLDGLYISGVFGGVATKAGTVSMTLKTAATRALETGSVGYTATTDTALGAGTIVVNGQSIAIAATDTVQTMLDKINTLSTITGVTAGFDGTNVNLVQKNYGAGYAINVSDVGGIVSGNINTTGINAYGTVSIGGVLGTFTGGQRAGDSGLMMTDKDGNNLLLAESGNATGANIAVGAVSANSLVFQFGANAGQSVQMSLTNMQTVNLGNTAVTGQTLKTIDVTTANGASNGLLIVDQAISQVSQLRAQLGAFQKNTIESTIRYLGISAENLSASESQIRDTNVSQEVVNLTKNQILQQAGMSVLAQANSAPNQVLSLLKG